MMQMILGNSRVANMAAGKFWRVLAAMAAVLTLLSGPLLAQTSVQDQEAQTQVGVRYGDHDGYSRIVFDVPAGVGYDVTEVDGTVTLVLDGNFDLDVSGLVRAGLANVASPDTRLDNGKRIVQLRMQPGSSIRHFRTGTRVVLDVLADGAVAAAPPRTAAAPESSTEETTAPDPVPSETVQPSVATPDPGLEENRLAVVPTFTEDPGDVTGDFQVSYASSGGMPQLVFEWAYPVATSVFMRAGYLWVIFDEPARANLSGVIPFLNEKLISAEQIPSLNATLVRFAVSEEVVSVGVIRQGSDWIVALRASPQEPQKPIVLRRQETNSDGFRVFVPFDRPGAKLSIVDPEVGDELEVVPLLESSIGTAQSRRFAQFEIMQSAQGLVVQKYSDQVVVTRFVNGVSIGSIANLALSAPQLNGRLGERDGGNNTVEANRIIELEKWRLGSADEFAARKQELYLALAKAPKDDLNDRRWDIARFYLAHNLASEAMAVLSLMLEDDPTMVESPPFRAVRGLANLRLGRLDDAQSDLDYNRLNAEDDIYLWRSLVADARGDVEKTLQLYERGRDLVDIYEDVDRADFRIAALRSAIALNRIDSANWELTWLRRQPLTPTQRAEADYLEGLFLEVMGETAEALAYFEGVEERDSRKAAAYAKFSAAELRHSLGDLDTTATAGEMEKLRYSWRGDRFEMKLLSTLGGLYLEDGAYRRGLETMREAVTAFPDEIGTRDIANQMALSFRDIYIEGAADSLPPISALALYYDFRELTPLGADGDQMIRRLTDRLVAVDLLDRAAELLDHQVRFRLEGVAQANIATRLAKIHLMNQAPEKAMSILRATRQAQLPTDVMHDRVLVEGRALIELGRYEEADVMLSDMSGNDIRQLRADIYWGAQDWPKLISTLDNLLGERWESVLPLEEHERLYIIRQAIAKSMLRDSDQSAIMRSRYLGMMQEGRFANAFDIITSPETHSSDEIRDIVRQTAAVDSLQSFMAAYRSEFDPSRAPAADDNGGM